MNIEMINPLDLPSVSFAGRKALPDLPGVYFVLDGDDEVLYIGKARRLVKRWESTQHHRYADVANLPGARICWLSISDESLLEQIEAACIAHFSPTLNRSPVPEQHRRFPLALPAELYKEVRRMAWRDGQRPMNNMIVMLLREAIEARRARGEYTGED